MIAVLVCFLMTTGCAKKTVLQGESKDDQAAAAAAAQQKKAPVAEPVKPVKVEPATEGEAKEKAAVKTETELADVRFDFDKSVLKPQDRETLKKHADFLMKNKNYDVVIEGNCDERGTAEYNLALGERRAIEAQKYLISLGVEKNRIKTISYGYERPLDPGHNEEAWAKNRRDHFVINLK